MRSIDAACMDAVSQSLAPRRGATLPVYSQQVERAAAGLYDTIEPLRQASKCEAENIGHAVNQMVKLCVGIIEIFLNHNSYRYNTSNRWFKALLELLQI